MQPPEQTSNQNKLPDSATVQNFLINNLKLSTTIVSSLVVNNEGGVSFAVTFDATEANKYIPEANKYIPKMKPGETYIFNLDHGNIIFIKNANDTTTCTADVGAISDIKEYAVPVGNTEPKASQKPADAPQKPATKTTVKQHATNAKKDVGKVLNKVTGRRKLDVQELAKQKANEITSEKPGKTHNKTKGEAFLQGVGEAALVVGTGGVAPLVYAAYKNRHTAKGVLSGAATGIRDTIKVKLEKRAEKLDVSRTAAQEKVQEAQGKLKDANNNSLKTTKALNKNIRSLEKEADKYAIQGAYVKKITPTSSYSTLKGAVTTKEENQGSFLGNIGRGVKSGYKEGYAKDYKKDQTPPRDRM